MTTWRDSLYDHLLANTSIAALIDERLAPVRHPQGTPAPRVNYFEVAGLPDNTLDGWSGSDAVRLQVDVWTEDYDEGVALKDLIRSRMEQPCTAFKAVCITDSDGPVENEAELFRRVLEFSLWTL